MGQTQDVDAGLAGEPAVEENVTPNAETAAAIEKVRAALEGMMNAEQRFNAAQQEYYNDVMASLADDDNNNDQAQEVYEALVAALNGVVDKHAAKPIDGELILEGLARLAGQLCASPNDGRNAILAAYMARRIIDMAPEAYEHMRAMAGPEVWTDDAPAEAPGSVDDVRDTANPHDLPF